MKKLCALIASIGLMAGVAQGQFLVQFQASKDSVNAEVQPVTFLAANLSLTDDGIFGTESGNILAKDSTTAWVDEYHYAYAPGGSAYHGVRSDTGYKFILNAETGFTFDLTLISFKHRATANGPGTVGISIDGIDYSGSGDSVSTTVTTYESESLNLSDLTTATIVLQGWDSGGSGGGEFQMNDLQVSGTVIPEPGTIALLALGLAGVFGLRRKLVA